MDNLLEKSKSSSDGEMYEHRRENTEILESCDLIAREIMKFKVGDYCIIARSHNRLIRQLTDIIDVPEGIELKAFFRKKELYITYPRAVIVWSLLCKYNNTAKIFKAESGETDNQPHFKIWRSK